MSDSVRPHRWQPTRLAHPWDSPGKNTGVGYHFLFQCMKVKRESQVAQSCPTQPTRLLRPWDSPGKSTGVGCHCLLRLSSWSSPIKWWEHTTGVFKLHSMESLPDAANSWRWRGRSETFHHHYHYRLILALQKMLLYLSRRPVNYTTCQVNYILFIFGWEIFLESWSNILQNSLSIFYKLVCSTWKPVRLKRANRTFHDKRKAEQ